MITTLQPTERYDLQGFSRRLADAFGYPERVQEFRFRVGGVSVLLLCAGSRLASRLTPALQHLAAPAADEAEITLCSWDAAETGAELPTLPDGLAAYLARGEMRGYAEKGVFVSYQFDAAALSLCDTVNDTAYYAVADATRLPAYLNAMPLRDLWHWTLQRRGRQLTHAGAVGTKHGGVLLAGPGGAGKSTIALACLAAGMRYAADDYCLLANHTQPTIYSLYCTGKLEAEHAQRFPSLARLSRNSGDKAVFFLKDEFAAQLVAELPLRAILLPCVTGQRETVLGPAAPGEAIRALAPSTIFQLPGGGAADFRFLAQVARRVPCYRLGLGTEIERIPQVISSLLESLPDA